MLDDARLSILLTEEPLRGELPHCQARVLCLDSPEKASDQESTANLDGGAAEANLAYVIYTSGPPAGPKGCRSRTALANLLEAMRALGNQ